MLDEEAPAAPRPSLGAGSSRGEGRKGSAAWIATIMPEIAAQKLQTQKERKKKITSISGPSPESLASTYLFTWE